MLLVALVGALLSIWPRSPLTIRGFGLVLTLALLATVRGQLIRWRWQMTTTPAAAVIAAPLAGRTLPWASIRQVRQLRLPTLAGAPRWACTVYIAGRQDRLIPLILFDNQIEDADGALAAIVAATPQAQHTLAAP